jgi:hypothetical protein
MKFAPMGPEHMTEVPIKNPSPPITSVNIDVDRVELVQLHRQVLKQTGRVELRTRDGQVSVLISKSELDGLEQALAILSDTDSVRDVRDQLARVAALAANPVAG